MFRYVIVFACLVFVFSGCAPPLPSETPDTRTYTQISNDKTANQMREAIQRVRAEDAASRSR